jgi:hypothetical protein
MAAELGHVDDDLWQRYLALTPLYLKPVNHFSVVAAAWRFVIALITVKPDVFNNDAIIHDIIAKVLMTGEKADVEVFRYVAQVIRLLPPHRLSELGPDENAKIWKILMDGLQLNIDKDHPSRLEIVRTVVAALGHHFSPTKAQELAENIGIFVTTHD